MELDHIKEFLVLAKERNYSKAAEKLYMSQSVLTKHIQKLENDLGFKLFIRTSPLTLTPAGEYFIREMKGEYDSITTLIDNAKLVDKGFAGTLSLGLANYSKSIYVPDIKLFQKEYPQTKINMVIKDQNDLLAALMNDEIDIATLYNITSPVDKMLDQFARMPIVKGQMGLLVNRDDGRFKDRKAVSISELKGMRYILIDNTYYRAIHRDMEFLAGKYGVHFKNTVLVPTLEDGLLHVLMYGGAMFVPGTDSPYSYGEEFRKISLKERDITYTRYYLWKMSNTNPSIMKFAYIARDRRAADISRKILQGMQ